MDQFDEWKATRPDARYWSEDELAIARLVWKEACKFYEKDIDDLKGRVRLLEAEVNFVERGYAQPKQEMPKWGNF